MQFSRLSVDWDLFDANPYLDLDFSSRYDGGRRYVRMFIYLKGKGYPDVATRQLVKSLSDNLPSTIPIMALVDADPYGIDIALTYKYGSKSMKHQNEGLAARRVQWMGVSTADILEMGIDRDALLPITVHDQKKASSMLCSTEIQLTHSLRRELMHMLHTRRKAEIEVIASAPSRFDRDESSCVPGSNTKSVNPLAQYLVQKITKWLALFSSLEQCTQTKDIVDDS